MTKVGEQILENSHREWKRLAFEQRTRDLILDMINSDALDSFTWRLYQYVLGFLLNIWFKTDRIGWKFFIYLSFLLTITEQILLTLKNSNKMLMDINTLVKKPISLKRTYIKTFHKKIKR